MAISEEVYHTDGGNDTFQLARIHVDLLDFQLYAIGTMKKALLFSLVFGLSAMSTVFAQSEDDFEIVQKGGGITVTGYTGNQKEITIPVQISGIPVFSIGRDAFSGKELTKITLPAGLKTIEEGAFSYNSLTALVIPDTVTGVGDNVFSDNQISEITLSSRLVFLGGGAFAGNKIERLVIPATLDHIPGSAFRGNPIKTLSLGGAKTVIARAFEDSAVESINVGSNVNINAMCGLDTSFVNFYNSNGKKAGTYTKNGRIWAIK